MDFHCRVIFFAHKKNWSKVWKVAPKHKSWVRFNFYIYARAFIHCLYFTQTNTSKIYVRLHLKYTGQWNFSLRNLSMKIPEIDLSRIVLQWANTKKWGRGSRGQFHTNHCMLSIRASNWCLCLRECGKGLWVAPNKQVRMCSAGQW